jgi:glycosyltransferase involved in cell wall biosynthesis
MRLLIVSPAFLPDIGGLELATAERARGLASRGFEVVVVTQTPGDRLGDTYRVVRRPTRRQLVALVRWCDVFYQANVSLRFLWPLLLVRRPWVVSHHSWYRQSGGRRALRDLLKVFALRFARASIAVSSAIAADLPTGTVVIENAYRDGLFRRMPELPRERDLVFVGRLVSDKGVDLLVDAMGRLGQIGLRPRLSIVGEGPEEQALKALASAVGVTDQVEFLGLRVDEDLVRILNAHEILVVPSRYNEPFGIVALEGIACGCAVVASAGGGLPDAVGPCGLLFANEDAADLAEKLATLLKDPSRREQLRAGAGPHLAAHSAEAVIDRYARIIEAASR